MSLSRSYDAAYSRAARLQPRPVRCTNHRRGKFVVAWLRLGERLYCTSCFKFLSRVDAITTGIEAARRRRK